MKLRLGAITLVVVLLQTAALAQGSGQKSSGWVEDEDVAVPTPAVQNPQYPMLAQPQPNAPQTPLLAAPRRMQPSPMYQQMYQKFFANDEMDDDDDTGFGAGRRKKNGRAAGGPPIPLNTLPGSNVGQYQQNYNGSYMNPWFEGSYSGTQQGFGAPMYSGPEFYNPYAPYYGGPAYITPGGGALPPME